VLLCLFTLLVACSKADTDPPKPFTNLSGSTVVGTGVGGFTAAGGAGGSSAQGGAAGGMAGVGGIGGSAGMGGSGGN
jgi:hypothetical protein